jgi:hypothetical protein
VEKFNFIVVIPPGVPCIRIHYKKPSVQPETATYCILTDRTSWLNVLNEIVVGYRIFKDLFDNRPLKQALDNILLAETSYTITKKNTVSDNCCITDIHKKIFFALQKSSVSFFNIKKVHTVKAFTYNVDSGTQRIIEYHRCSCTEYQCIQQPMCSFSTIAAVNY